MVSSYKQWHMCLIWKFTYWIAPRFCWDYCSWRSDCCYLLNCLAVLLINYFYLWLWCVRANLFTVAIKYDSLWVYIDDMCSSVRTRWNLTPVRNTSSIMLNTSSIKCNTRSRVNMSWVSPIKVDIPKQSSSDHCMAPNVGQWRWIATTRERWPRKTRRKID